MKEFLLGVIVALAFVVEGAAGFGSTIVTVTLGAMLFDMEYVLAVFIPANMVLSAYLVLRHRASVDYRLLATRIVPIMLGGMLLGFFLKGQFQPDWFRPAFAVFVCVLAASQLLSGLRAVEAQSTVGPGSTFSGLGWLLSGGVVHGVFASGGPLVVYYVGRRLPEKGRFRATLSALWLFMNAVFLAQYAKEGRLSSQTAWVSLGLLVPLVVGIFGGEWLHDRLDPRRFRLFVACVLLVAGLGLLLSWLRSL